MPKIINTVPRSPEWHAWREGKITASNVATLMCLNPNKSPLMLYTQMIEGKEETVNEAMARGSRLEPHARAWAEDYFTCSFPEVCMEHDEFPWFTASLDGWNKDGRVVKAIECKAPGEKNHQQARLGVVPSFWYPQCQAVIEIAKINEMAFISYFNEMDVEVIIVKRDEKFIAKMMAAVHEFRKCLVDLIPPDPMDMDLLNVDTPDAVQLASELSHIQSDMKRLKESDETIRDQLKGLCEGKSALIGGQYRFKKSMRPGNVDYKAIPELANVDLNAYRKEKIESWRFS